MELPFPTDPARLHEELAAFQRKVVDGLGALRLPGPVSYGSTPREAVYREDKLTLWHFQGEKPPTSRAPVLICYALVNTPWMVDLQDDRSLVRNLLAQGEDVYLIDWGFPDAADRWLGLEDYVLGYLDRSIDAVRARHGGGAVNLLGICQGGTFSLCYTALYPEKIRNLITMVTPVDFHAGDSMLSHWARNIDVDALVHSFGNIPAWLMNHVFLTLKPLRLMQQKYVGMVDILDKPGEMANFLRMEKWIFDSPDQAGEAFGQFTRDFFQANKLVKGQVVLGGRHVDLATLTTPILNIYAEQDHLVPPASSQALRHATGSADYTELAFKGGHIGIYVSGRAQREVPSAIHAWLQVR
ncbi:class III poly(R)-hydroxyalkanoic acid synthase subunit PhaC [Pinirhizobacter sp.]|jgi:polyhydroxyalkanoate synthase|uniref:class III poly(R)-hydroxyalkanoic acid synthase subunit PhaC n=1 Tax=Pinirhizobacter sp. TaxID=2950432 RepID=UPI002F3F0156